MDAREHLYRTIDAMPDARVLVVGDVMLDVYERCAVRRISPEAPVPVATVLEDSSFLGGAGNVASNVRALGASVSIAGVIGSDREGETVRKLLQEQGINDTGLVVEEGRVTTVKRRIVSGTQQLIRIDREMTEDIDAGTELAICDAIARLIPEHDVVVVSDYCKGLLTESVISFVKEIATQSGKKIFVDSKSRHLSRYSGVHLIKPNKAEAEAFAGEAFAHDYANLETVGRRLSAMLSSNLVVTLGGDGMALFEVERFAHKRTLAQDVFDVSGAGDTVLSVVATAVAVGADLESAVDLSNHAAGYVVSKLGTVACNQEVLRAALQAAL